MTLWDVIFMFLLSTQRDKISEKVLFTTKANVSWKVFYHCLYASFSVYNFSISNPLCRVNKPKTRHLFMVWAPYCSPSGTKLRKKTCYINATQCLLKLLFANNRYYVVSMLFLRQPANYADWEKIGWRIFPSSFCC